MAKAAGVSLNKNKDLDDLSPQKAAGSGQHVLELGIEIQRNVNGIEMMASQVYRSI